MDSPKDSSSGAVTQEHPEAHMSTCQMVKFSLMRLLMELFGTMVFMMIFIAGSSYMILLGLWVMMMFAFEISGA